MPKVTVELDVVTTEALRMFSEERQMRGAEAAALLMQDALIHCGILALGKANRSHGAQRSTLQPPVAAIDREFLDRAEALMKRCQRGVGGRDALAEAHDIMAEAYGTIGRMVGYFRPRRSAP